MVLPAHPHAGPSAARGNRAQIPALLRTFLALIATLLGRPRALAPAWHTLAGHDATPWLDDEVAEVEAYAWPEGRYWSPRTHYHADCDPSILYVIGPRPNRGLTPLPRRTPIPRPKTARAPPMPNPCVAPRPQSPRRNRAHPGPWTHALNVPITK